MLRLALLSVGLLSGALVPRLAHAGDACLAGDAALADRRALAALRAATDAACPCATFTSRSVYQRCAKAQLDGAVAGATLRRECRRNATAVNRGATCGDSKHVACGRVRSDGTPSCRLKTPGACHGGRSFEERICDTETRCSDVVDWTAGTCIDPRRPGPYAAGVRVVTYTKPSEVDGSPRALETYVWYPAPAGAGPVDPDSGGVDDAPIAPGAFPLVMFSHGSCGFPTQSLFLTPLLATYGFVVAAPPHPGNTINQFPRCGTPQAQVASFQERPADILFVLDQLLAADGDPTSPFHGAIDPSRLGMSGHSFGGLTTTILSGPGSRFNASLAMAPATVGTRTMTIPSMTMIGGIDSVVSVPGALATYERSATPRYFTTVNDAGHYAFSDNCFPSADCNPPTTLTQDEAHALVLRYALPFLEVYVAGDVDFFSFLTASPPPGLVLDDAL